MADDKSLSIAEDFLRALKAKQTEKALSLFEEDSVWIAPEGTFTGKIRIAGYLNWQFAQGQDLKIAESGNSIVAEGPRAFLEHTVAYRRSGERIEYTVLCSLDLRNGKVARIRTVYDRLSLERQLVKGRVSRWAVGHLLRHAEKGLRWPGK